jgi:hypothetical protein
VNSNKYNKKDIKMTSIDEEWKSFLSNQSQSNFSYNIVKNTNTKPIESLNPKLILKEDTFTDTIPKCEELYISTKTKVLFLNQEIDIHRIFWEIPIVEYWKPQTGIIKKQMKVVSKDVSEYEQLREKLKSCYYYTENVIKQIDNPTARRIKFKDERKITIGISRKDIINSRGKVKNAFYNCFAMIIRLHMDNTYREVHVKVFNTGKLEIPGVINQNLLDRVKEMILDIIKPYYTNDIYFIDTDRDENVLINSNFNCGFFINREKLHSILRSEKYGIESAYDPCSYPGVKCKFYFNNEVGFDEEKQTGKISREDRALKMNELNDNKKYTEVSFMIFRTGSCLIVGNCSEKILKFIFEFVKKILVAEYDNIYVENEEVVDKSKKTKIRKKTITMTQEKFRNATS